GHYGLPECATCQVTPCTGFLVHPFSKETVFTLAFHRCDPSFPAFFPGSRSLHEGHGCLDHDGFSVCSTRAIRLLSRCVLSSSAMLSVWQSGRILCLHHATPTNCATRLLKS